MRRRWTMVLLAIAVTSGVAAQGSRTATTVDALITHAAFFHGRSVVLHHGLLTEGDVTRLLDTPKPVYVFWRDRSTVNEGELRGEFWDLGRIEPGDSRFAAYDFTRLLDRVNRGGWPARDQLFVILGASVLPSSPPREPTLRAIALAPERYVGRDVRIVGRFKGRNLYGDLPTALGKGKWDFVLQSAEGALWVTGVRPRGSGFDLDPGKRVDTGRWLLVTGIVRREGGTTYVEGTKVEAATEPTETTVEVELPPTPAQPPPQVIFSAPVAEDHEVDPSAPIRIQFSRDMDARTVRDRVRVSYVSPPGAPPAPAPKFTVMYNDAAHAIEIRFAQPLERFRQVKVELLEGMTSLDGQPLAPWTLTFTTGG